MEKPNFKIELHEDGQYFRLYVSHPDVQGRIRKRLGNKLNFEKDVLKMRIRVELENYFKERKYDKTSAESIIENFISLHVKCNISIFDFKDEFLDFKSQIKNKRTRVSLSKSTLSGYRTALKYFEEFMIKKNLKPHPSSITESVLNNFYDHIPGSHNYKVKIHTKIKNFIKYLEMKKRLQIDIGFKLSSFTEEYDNQCPGDDDIALTEAQVAKLINLRDKFINGEISIENYHETSKIPSSVREQQFKAKQQNLIRCLDCFLLMISTGMYYSDIMKSSILFAGTGSLKHIRYRRAKNNSLCKGIPIKNEGAFIGEAIIKQYEIANGSKFPLDISLTHFNKHLERISDLAGLDMRVTNKMARKTFASILYFNREMPIHLVQMLLGHTNVTKTMHYLRISDDSLATEVNRYM